LTNRVYTYSTLYHTLHSLPTLAVFVTSMLVKPTHKPNPPSFYLIQQISASGFPFSFLYLFLCNLSHFCFWIVLLFSFGYILNFVPLVSSSFFFVFVFVPVAQIYSLAPIPVAVKSTYIFQARICIYRSASRVLDTSVPQPASSH
jgi:hypothetical protein